MRKNEDAYIASRDIASLEQFIGKAPMMPSRWLAAVRRDEGRKPRFDARRGHDVPLEGVKLRRAS